MSQTLPTTETNIKESELTNAEKIARRVSERNSWSTFFEPTPLDVAKMLISRSIHQAKIPPKDVLDKLLPILPLSFEALESPPKDETKLQATWIGHATVFVQMGGWNIITDPIFSNRCSPSQYVGPKRYRKAPCTIPELMMEKKIPIHVVLISHNHYDHLDTPSVESIAACALERKQPVVFVVALGLKDWFHRYIPDSCRGGNRVEELDWHESYCLTQDTGGKGGGDERKKGPLTITGLPAQHWSNRYGWDKDKTLWCGFGVTLTSLTSSSPQKFMFCGDTGYFEDVYEIGKRYGPFDLAAIPIGAYEPRSFMKSAHINPEEAVKIQDALKAKRAIPIHWGTFHLAFEGVVKPKRDLELAMQTAKKDHKSFEPIDLGETIVVDTST